MSGMVRYGGTSDQWDQFDSCEISPIANNNLLRDVWKVDNHRRQFVRMLDQGSNVVLEAMSCGTPNYRVRCADL
jgi:hypothetical protein